jgi:hypothetical protein
MGREVKRVPLDFDWPLKQTWKGYINPHYECSSTCGDCEGSGYSFIARQIRDRWYGDTYFSPAETGSEPFTGDSPALVAAVTRKILWNKQLHEEGNQDSSYQFYLDHSRLILDQAISKECRRLAVCYNKQWSHHLDQDDVDALVEADRLWDFTRRLLPGQDLREFIRVRAYYLWLESGKPEGRDLDFHLQAEREYSRHWLPFHNGHRPMPREVNDWSISGIGHDAINRVVCVRAKLRRMGLGEDAIDCQACKGTGSIWDPPEAEKLADEWENIEPPEGEAYQLWETVSEGSPVSPPFAEPRELALWLECWHSDGIYKHTAEQWEEFIRGPGWSPSMVSDGNKLMSGVEAMIS